MTGKWEIISARAGDVVRVRDGVDARKIHQRRLRHRTMATSRPTSIHTVYVHGTARPLPPLAASEQAQRVPLGRVLRPAGVGVARWCCALLGPDAEMPGLEWTGLSFLRNLRQGCSCQAQVCRGGSSSQVNVSGRHALADMAGLNVESIPSILRCWDDTSKQRNPRPRVVHGEAKGVSLVGLRTLWSIGSAWGRGREMRLRLSIERSKRKVRLQLA